MLEQIDSSPSFSSELSRTTPLNSLADIWFPIRIEGLKTKSSKRVKVSLDALLPYFGHKAVSRISQEDLDNWQVKRGKQISTSTFNKERGELLNILDFAVEKGIINRNPGRPDPGFRIRGLKPKQNKSKHPYILSQTEFRNLLNEVRTFNNDAPKGVIRPKGVLDPRTQEAGNLIEFLAYSGMRVSEAINIKWADVQFGGNYPSVTIRGGDEGTKNGEVRVIPLFPDLHKLLENIKKSKDVVKPEDKLFKIKSARKTLGTACEKLKMPQVGHHAFRHYFASNAVQTGLDFKVIADWLGHKDGGLLVAKTYSHLRQEHSWQMAKRMNTHSYE